MRLWKRIRQVSLRAVSKVFWQVRRRSHRHKQPASADPDVTLIHEMLAKGTPMSLASVKAAVDATAPAKDTKRPDVHGMESRALPSIDGSGTIFIG